MRIRTIESRVLALLAPTGATSTRAYIESFLMAEIYASPVETTKCLGTLVKEGRIVRTLVGTTNHHDAHVFSRAPIGSAMESWFSERINYKIKIFAPSPMRFIGENYTRCLLIRSGLFRSIPKAQRLGSIPVKDSKEPADITASYKDPAMGHYPLMLEAKNQREWFHRSSVVFLRLLKKALAADAVPVLSVAHLSDDGVDFCELIGIGTLIWTRQLAPRSIQAEVESLRSIIGPIRFEYLDPKRPLLSNSDDVQRDLRCVSDPGWLKAATTRWLMLRDTVRGHVEQMSSVTEWPGVARDLAEMASKIAVPTLKCQPTAGPEVDMCPYFIGFHPSANSTCERCGFSWAAHHGIINGAPEPGGNDASSLSMWPDTVEV